MAKNTDNLHTFPEDDTEDDSDENDQESGDGDDFEESIFTSSTQIVDSSIVRVAYDEKNDKDETTETLNEFVKVSVSTMQPSINIAVNFNLSQLVFIYCAIIFAVSFVNSSSIM
jgi:hypothetical protein